MFMQLPIECEQMNRFLNTYYYNNYVSCYVIVADVCRHLLINVLATPCCCSSINIEGSKKEQQNEAAKKEMGSKAWFGKLRARNRHAFRVVVRDTAKVPSKLLEPVQRGQLHSSYLLDDNDDCSY